MGPSSWLQMTESGVLEVDERLRTCDVYTVYKPIGMRWSLKWSVLKPQLVHLLEILWYWNRKNNNPNRRHVGVLAWGIDVSMIVKSTCKYPESQLHSGISMKSPLYTIYQDILAEVSIFLHSNLEIMRLTASQAALSSQTLENWVQRRTRQIGQLTRKRDYNHMFRTWFWNKISIPCMSHLWHNFSLFKK